MNPIKLPCRWQHSGSFSRESTRTHRGQDVFASFGSIGIRTIERAATRLAFWLILLKMNRRKIFQRI